MEKENINLLKVLEKEIDLIEGCIKRMANNSFLLKGWMISLFAVLLTFLPKKMDMFLILVILIGVIISFWYLDAFFLLCEKKYRKLYEWVIKERLEGNSEKLYDLNLNRFEAGSIGKMMISKTLRCFYGIPLVIIIIITIYKIFI